VGMEEELFPSAFAMQSPRELEEERRLFYVAITRAEERCYISFAKSRFRNGQVNMATPSRFIRDIDPAFLDQPSAPKQNLFREERDDLFEGNIFGRRKLPETKTYYPKNELPANPQPPKKLRKLSGSSNSQGTVSPASNPSIPVGKFVKHQMFGIGKVLNVSSSGADEKAEIDFGEKGVKSLLLKFARLEVLD